MMPVLHRKNLGIRRASLGVALLLLGAPRTEAHEIGFTYSGWVSNPQDRGFSITIFDPRVTIDGVNYEISGSAYKPYHKYTGPIFFYGSGAGLCEALGFHDSGFPGDLKAASTEKPRHMVELSATGRVARFIRKRWRLDLFGEPALFDGNGAEASVDNVVSAVTCYSAEENPALASKYGVTASMGVDYESKNEASNGDVTFTGPTQYAQGIGWISFDASEASRLNQRYVKICRRFGFLETRQVEEKRRSGSDPFYAAVLETAFGDVVKIEAAKKGALIVSRITCRHPIGSSGR